MTTSGKPRVLVVSPKYFPIEEGLGHYTTEFCRHLANVADVAVWTARSRGDVGKASGHAPGRVVLIDNVERWTWAGPFVALARALAFAPDAILIEFVPFMYARGGINLTLVALAWFLSARARILGKGHVQIMFHELWFPFAWRPADAVMHVSHRAMVLGLTLAARLSLCSTSHFAELVRRNARPLGRNVRVLAVGSNLERENPTGETRTTPRDPRELRIGLFGSAHPSKGLALVLRSLREGSRESPWSTKITIIGMTREQVCAEAPELSDWIESEVHVAGPLEASEAADRLGEQDFLVGYFADGVSGRRGSLLAALCEGTPVVTSWADWSDDVFRGRDFVKLFPYDEAVFAAGLVGFLRSTERPFAGVARENVREFYRRHFSWTAIVERYVALSGFDTRP